MRTVHTLGAAALCLALAACSSSTTGGSGSASGTAAGSATTGAGTAAGSTAAAGSSAASSSAPASSAPASSGAATASPADTARLKAATLQQGDLPSGWTGSAAQPDDPNGDRLDKQLRSCAGAKDTTADRVTKVQGDEFNLGAASVDSSATLYRSSADISADVALLRSPKIDSCYGQLARGQLASGMPQGAHIDSFEFHISPGTNGGPSAVAGLGAGRVVLTAQGKTVQVYADVAFLAAGRTEVEIDFTGVGQRVPASVRAAAITKVAQRLGG